MKFKFLLSLLLIVFATQTSCGQTERNSHQNDNAATRLEQKQNPKKVSILGDSYSTFAGWIPEGYIAWYRPVPKEGRPTDVTEVDQTWWDIYIKKNGYQLEKNNSYSGSTICNTGYEKKDYSDRSFISRVADLGNPDIIFVYGATNDSWADSPLGDYVYENWTPKELKSFRPASAYMLSELKRLYPEAEITFIVNDAPILKPEIISSIREICDHYGVKYVMIKDLSTMSGHPDQKGMQQIVQQLEEAK